MKWEWSGRPASLDQLKVQVGTGWGGIIERLVTDLKALGWDGVVTQVKEKFGGLRFYVAQTTDAQWARIEQAEKESFATCEECGATEGVAAGSWGGYWIKTLCPAHGQMFQAKNAREEPE